MIGNNMKTSHTTHKGFTLFYALLVSSLALAIGASIFDITVREISLSNAATQSQYAVYAADTGSECALYWDSKYTGANSRTSAFATSSADTGAATSGTVCVGTDIAAIPWTVQTSATAATTTFSMSVGPAGTPRCVMVTVAKVGNPSMTTITSHGYNTCVQGPLQLERVLQVSY